MTSEHVELRAASTSGLRWWPARVYYGWALVSALGVTAIASYGVLSYAVAVFIAPMRAELGWTNAEITGAFSVGMLVAGLAAIPVGRWVDRHGARGLMAMGSILGAVVLVAWSFVRTLAGFYALWLCMGLAMAAVLYEPMFTVVTTWFYARRSRALTVLTFIGGFASVLFVPLATWLVEHHGWRTALVWLAAIYGTVAVPAHALVLRRRPADLGLVPDGDTPILSAIAAATSVHAAPLSEKVDARSAWRSRSFRWLAIAFALSSMVTTAVTVHLVPLLLERGHGAAFAGSAMGVLGLMALPGRVVFTPLGERRPRAIVTAAIFASSALGCAVLLAWRSTMAVWVFVALFGAGFGAITPARAALLAETYGSAHYGQISGVLALLTSVARAAAPVGASLVYVVGAGLFGAYHGYDAVLGVLLLLCVGSGVAVLIAGTGRAPVVARLPESSESGSIEMPSRLEARYFPREALMVRPDVPGASAWGVALDKTLLTFFEVKPHCRFDRHKHESEQITMVLEGELYFELDAATHCVGRGEVIAIPSNVPHAVFTRDHGATAIDAWSPVLSQYIKPTVHQAQ